MYLLNVHHYLLEQPDSRTVTPWNTLLKLLDLRKYPLGSKTLSQVLTKRKRKKNRLSSEFTKAAFH